jgi:hypothetical protein
MPRDRKQFVARPGGQAPDRAVSVRASHAPAMSEPAPHSEPRERRPVSWAPAALLFAGCVLLQLCYLFPGGPWTRGPAPLDLIRDEGTVLYDSLRIAHGAAMYRDFFEFQGPVFYHVYAAVFALAGASLPAARLAQVLIAAGGSVALAILVSRFAGRWAGVGAALVHTCMLVPLWPVAYPHWLAETLALTALVLICRDRPDARRDFLAGALLGLCLATILSLGLPLLVAAVGTVALLGLPAGNLRASFERAGSLLLGAATPLLLIALYFATRGALGDLIYCSITWPLGNYARGQQDAVEYAAFTQSFIDAHGRLVEPWRWLGVFGLKLTRWLPRCAFWALPAAAWSTLRLWLERGGSSGATLLAVSSLAALTPLFAGKIRMDLTHVAMLASFGLSSAAVLVGPFVTRWRTARWAVSLAFMLVGLATLANYAYKLHITWDASRQNQSFIAELKQSDRSFQALQNIFERVEARVPPGDPMVVGSLEGFHYMFLRPAAVWYTALPWHEADDYLSDAQWHRIADEIAERSPVLMALVPYQWQRLLAFRPDLVERYRGDPTNLELVTNP